MEPFSQTPDPMNQAPGPVIEESRRSSLGPLAGIVIIVILLLGGALYFWGAYLNGNATEDVPPLLIGEEEGARGAPSAVPESDAAAGLPPHSTSDEVSSIEADLTAMDLDALRAESEAGVQAIE